MDHKPTTRPIPDALMIRAIRPGVSALCRVPEHRMAAFLKAGWVVLITESQIRSNDIEDSYWSHLKERR